MADVVEVMAEAIFTKWAELEGSDMTWEEALATRCRPGEFPQMAKIVPMARAEAQAALSALDAAGYAVVPKEPTKAMRDAAMHHLLNTGNIYTREGEETIVVETYVTKAVYAAMLSAAQVSKGTPT